MEEDVAAVVPVPARVSVDPRRALVQAERHARPPLPVEPVAVCEHLVFHNREVDVADERRACLDICVALDLVPSGELTDQIRAVGDRITLKWERHTEFSSYTIVQDGMDDTAGYTPWSTRENLPWGAVPGQLLVAQLIGVERRDEPAWSAGEDFAWREGTPLCASLVMSDTTLVESDLALDASGHVRFLVRTSSTEPSRIGRLVQRLIEIETYGALCLYAWKDVKEIGPLIGRGEGELGRLIQRLTRSADESDEAILRDLTELASAHEELTARTHFRLNASLAYHEIVVRRLNELREQRVEGRQRLANFIQRRMNPAARTYRSVLVRQAELAERIARATSLLRGRIEVAIGRQNQDLLTAMNDRAEAQYRLQKTVEGLSVVAISYYALGILAFAAAPIAGRVDGLGVKEIVGLAVPLVLLAVWLSIRKLRR